MLRCPRLRPVALCLAVLALAPVGRVFGQGGVAVLPAPASVTDAAGPKDAKPPKPKKEHVTMEQLPEPVRQALVKKAGTAVLEKLEKEVRDGQPNFKAAWTVNDMKQELRLAADGSLMESKSRIAPAELPEVVAAAAKKTIPDLKDTECKKVIKPVDGKPQESFEVKGEVDGAKKHLLISPDGQVEMKGPPGPPHGPKGPKGPKPHPAVAP